MDEKVLSSILNEVPTWTGEAFLSMMLGPTIGTALPRAG